MAGGVEHWDGVYGEKAAQDVSWYQSDPEVSTDLIERFGPTGGVVDIGAGASVLADDLLASGRTDLTLLDVSAEALDETRQRLGTKAEGVTFVVADLLTWEPTRTFNVWHDRAVFHFLADPADRAAYVRTATSAVVEDGVIVLGTFAEDGPEECSGLPTARYDAEALAGLFSAEFTLEESLREVHRTPWGSTQPFTWVVLRHLSS